MSESDEITLRFRSDAYDGAKDPFLKDEDKTAIEELLPQILLERQSFLNLSEEQLREEIALKNRNGQTEDDSKIDIDDTNQNEDNEGGEKSENSFQNFQRQKFELLGHINSAMNETSLSLDFVSLLMSINKPNITKSTISPHLSENVPVGSLSSDRLNSDPDAKQSETNEKNKNKQKPEMIGLGWKYQSLNHIREIFQNSGNQLRQQVNIEKVYWSKINQVLGHGEVLFRVRDPLDGSRAIGVKYGYGDSGSSYFDKGMAVLRKDEHTGELTFSPIMTGNNKISIKATKFTRVRILSKIDDDFMLTGQSVFEKDMLRQKSDSRVINDIERARYFLFEEDLFFHLIREAKNLITYNVSIISNKIIIEIHDQVVEIESVIYDENNEEELDNTYQNINLESSRNNVKAQAVLTFLKLMLCCYYNYNLELKQKIPTSFTKWKQSNSHPLILRPLIGHIRHEINVHNIHTIFHKILRHLDPTKFTHEIQEEKLCNLKKNANTNPFRKAVEKPSSIFKLVLRNQDTNEHLLIELEVTSTEIFVDLILNLTISKFRSLEDLNQNQQGSNVLQLLFTDIHGIEESLEWTILNFTGA